MTKEQLDAIRRRAEAATEGPWEADDRGEGKRVIPRPRFRIMAPKSKRRMVPACLWDEGSGPACYDADFIAHSRQDVPALLAYIDRLHEVENAARDYKAMVDNFLAGGITGEQEWDNVPALVLSNILAALAEWRGK